MPLILQPLDSTIRRLLAPDRQDARIAENGTRQKLHSRGRRRMDADTPSQLLGMLIIVPDCELASDATNFSKSLNRLVSQADFLGFPLPEGNDALCSCDDLRASERASMAKRCCCCAARAPSFLLAFVSLLLTPARLVTRAPERGWTGASNTRTGTTRSLLLAALFFVGYI